MTFLEKYQKGEFQTVYEDINNLGQDAFSSSNFEQVSAVLHETFRRVQHNLQLIHDELRKLDYRFLADKYDDANKPFVLPPTNIEDALDELNQRVDPKFVPLSLQFFYRYVGAVDFTWDWESFPEIPWEGSDPVVIVSVGYLLDWIGDYVGSDDMFIGPDDLHKDNISGDAYYLSLSKYPVVDNLITGYDLLFIDYLRMTLDNSGFAMADKSDNAELQEFCKSLRPRLLPI